MATYIDFCEALYIMMDMGKAHSKDKFEYICNSNVFKEMVSSMNDAIRENPDTSNVNTAEIVDSVILNKKCSSYSAILGQDDIIIPKKVIPIFDIGEIFPIQRLRNMDYRVFNKRLKVGRPLKLSAKLKGRIFRVYDVLVHNEEVLDHYLADKSDNPDWSMDIETLDDGVVYTIDHKYTIISVQCP